MDIESSVCSSSSNFWGPALVFVSDVEEYAEPRLAWVRFSNCLWWKYVPPEDGESEPCSLLSFQRSHGIVLHRLQPPSDWTIVERTIRREDTDHGSALIVPGRLISGKQRNRAVEIGFVFENLKADNLIMSLRVRIAPWQLRYSRMCEWYSKSNHSSSVLDCVQNLGNASESDDSSVDGTEYWSLPFEMRCFAENGGYSSEEVESEDFHELEAAACVERSIYVVGESCEWLARCMYGRFSEIVAFSRRTIVSLLDPRRKMDETALREFFEAQEEAISTLENAEVALMGTRKTTLPGMWQRKAVYALDRVKAIFEELLRSNGTADRCNASRVLSGCIGQYSCITKELNVLTGCNDETEESNANVQRLLLECSVTMRRFLFQDERPDIGFIDILRELADTYELQNEMETTEDILIFCLTLTRDLVGEGHVTERLLGLLVELAEVSVARGYRWVAYQNYCESLTVSRQLYGENADRPSVADIMFMIGTLLEKERDYEEAKTILEESVRMKRRLVGEIETETLAAGIVFLAHVLVDLGSLDDAERRYRECLELWEGVYGVGVDNTDTAYALHRLGDVMEKKGELDEALLIFNECLSMKQRLLDEDDDAIADLMFSIGRIRVEYGELDEAELLCRECIDMQRRMHGDNLNRPVGALALHELAMIHRRRGNLLESSRSHREFLKFLHETMDQSIYWSAPKKDEVVYSLFSTYSLNMHRIIYDDLDDTEEALRDALSAEQDGNDECYSPGVVLAMHQLGGFLLRKEARRDNHFGEEMIRKSFSVLEKIIDEHQDHWLISEDKWFVVGNLMYMANSCLSNGHKKKAESLFRECLGILRDVHGTEQDCLDIADCLKGISMSLSSSKTKGSEKHDLLWESFGIVRRVSGDSGNGFRLVVNALDDLVEFELEHGTAEEVRIVVKECLDVARGVHGEGVDHEDVASCLGFLGRISQKQRDLDSSENWYRSCWEMKERLSDISATDKGVIYELGDLSLASSRFDDAERLFRESFDGNGNEMDRAVTFQVLARSLFDAGEVEKAKRIFKNCLEAYENFTESTFSSSNFAHEKCSDEYPFCLGFLKLRKQILPAGHVHPGTVLALVWLVRAATAVKNFHNAERWSIECLGMMNLLFGDEDSELASSVYCGLAGPADERGAKNEAKKLFRRSLEMDRRLQGSNITRVSTALTVFSLASLHIKYGELEEAEQFSREFVEIDKKLDGIASRNISNSTGTLSNVDVKLRLLFDLAEAYWNQGSCIIAERLFRECLNLARELLIDSTEFVDLAIILQKLACLVLEQGKLNEAKELFCESVYLLGDYSSENELRLGVEPGLGCLRCRVLSSAGESEKQSFRCSLEFNGLQCPSAGIGIILYHLGTIAWNEGCYEDAGLLWNKSLIVRRHIYESEDEPSYSVLRSLKSLAEVKRSEHAYEEAVQLYRECWEKYQIIYAKDPDHESAVSVLIRYATCLFENGELEEADIAFEKCQAVVNEIDSFELKAALVLYWRSQVACERKEVKAATEYFERSREFYEEASEGEYESCVLLTKITRVQVRLALQKGDLEEAEKHTRQHLVTCRKVFRNNPETEELATTLSLLARLELAKGELEEAEECVRQAFDIRHELHCAGSDHEEIADLLALRAEVMFNRGAKEDASSTMGKSLSMYKRVFKRTPNHRHITRVERRLQELQNEMPKSDDITTHS